MTSLELGSSELWPLEGQNVYGSKMIFIELKTNGEFEMRRRLSVLLTFSDFTTAIRSMMSLNSSLYLAAKAIFTFQVCIINKFLSLF